MDAIDPNDDSAEVLGKIIAGLESGTLTQFTLRARMADGTVEEIQFGYNSEEERTSAMAKLLRHLNELH
jgi:hypothetical protein